MIKAKLLHTYGTWRQVADRARNTIGLDEGVKEPSEAWKIKILAAEHSPIRILRFVVRMTIPYWVSVHFVRHHVGTEHFVSTQRSDRTNKNRNDLPQGAIVSHDIEVNAQALLNISLKRLCHCASPETRDAWESVLREVAKVQPELVGLCVKPCVKYGYCPEYKCCGYVQGTRYQQERLDHVTKITETYCK